MKHIYTLILTLLIYTTATGQGVTPLGQIRGTTEALGGFINDSDWQVPVRPLIKWSYWNTNKPYIAHIQVNPADTLPYYMKSTGVYYRFLTTNDPVGTGTVTSVGLVAGNNITITGTNPITTAGTLTITATGGSGSVTSVGAVGGAGINVTGSPITGAGVFTITGTGSLTAGTGITIGGTYPTYTVTNTSPSSGGTVTSVAATGAGGINITGSPITSTGTLTVTSTGTITPGTGISLTGSWPTYTITNSSPSSGGTVTSIGETSAAAAYSFSPTSITTNGTFTMTPMGNSTEYVKGDGNLGASVFGTVTSVGIAPGTGISVSGSPITSSGIMTVTSTGTITSGTGISLTGSWPTYTVTNTSPSSGGTVTSVAATGGTGIIVTGSPITGSGTLTVTATGGLTAGTGISLSGSFPTYTVTNTSPSSGGTVTSVAATGGTGITVAGSPITGSGTLTVTATGGLTAGTGISLAGSFPTYTVTNSSPSSGGTVTSLLVKSNAAAYSVTPTTPITSSGTFSIVPTGLSSQFVKGDGSLDGTTYGSGTVTSVGVVQGTNMYVTGTSPITTSGTFTFTPSQNPVDSSVTFASQTLTTDVLPASGSGKLFSTNQTGTEQPQWNPSVVTPYLMQGSLSDHQFSKLYPNLGGTQLIADGPDFLFNDGNSNLFPAIGATALVNAVYDATNRLPNIFNESTTSSALANSSAGWYYASTSKSNGVFIQNTNYYGGAILTITFGLSSYFSTQRLFIGYDTSNNLQPSATTDPSAILNSVGLSKDVGDATLQFITNGRSGTATKVNTGVTPTTGNEYRLTITINPNPATNGIYMTLETLTKSALPTKVSSGKLTSNIPVNGVALQPVIWANTGSGTSAVVLNFILMTQERL